MNLTSIKKRVWLSLLLAGGLFAFQAQASTLVYCSEGSPEGFDPALYASGTTFDASSKPIYDRLVRFERGSTKVVPGLAKSYRLSKNAKVITFKLRKGVKFHTTSYFKPTRDFNADDVIFSFKRQMDKKNPYHTYSGASWEYFNGMGMPKLIKSIKKLDNYTVQFVLNKPEAPIIANLAMDFASILSKEYADQLHRQGKEYLLNQKPIGTGPFQFVVYQKDAMIRYKANPNYWGADKAKVDNLVFSITPDASVRYQKLKAGECHIMAYPNPGDIKRMKKDRGIKVIKEKGLNIGYLAYNTKQPPFNKRDVRKALNMAINKKAILKAVYEGAGVVAKNPIPPTMWSYNKRIKDDPYSPKAARALLAKAGVKNLTTKIWAMPVQRPYNPNARRMAEMIQADWAKVGVKAKIVSYEWGQYLKLSKSVKRDGAALLGWVGDNGDPDNFLAALLSCQAVGGSNRAHWCNPRFEKLIQKAKLTGDRGARAALYRKAQVIFKREAPWATIAHSVSFTPLSTKVKGYKPSPFGVHEFQGVSIK